MLELTSLYGAAYHGLADGTAGAWVILAVMIYAVQGGLSTAADILGRTQGSVLWFLFYGTFVIAVSIHGAIGIRTVAFEWLGLKGVLLEAFMWLLGFGLFALGARAVWAVTFS